MKKFMFILSIVFLAFISANTIFAKDFSYGIARARDNMRPNPGAYIEKVLKENNGVYIGEDEKVVYLTFDCGYENGHTAEILDALRDTNTLGCFFITGHYLTSATDLVKRMHDEGHIIGNHSYYHKNFAKIGNSMIKEEITSLEKKYEELIGAKMSSYVRPPEGNASESSLKYINEIGYKTVFWSLAYVDWHKDKVNGKDYSYNNVMSRMHNGAIILMHTVSPDNSSALKDIILDLKEQGYTFKTLDEL